MKYSKLAPFETLTTFELVVAASVIVPIAALCAIGQSHNKRIYTGKTNNGYSANLQDRNTIQTDLERYLNRKSTGMTQLQCEDFHVTTKIFLPKSWKNVTEEKSQEEKSQGKMSQEKKV